jgi:hypothetical protein
MKNSDSSEIIVFTGRKVHASGILELLVHVLDLLLINCDLARLEDWGFNQSQVGVSIEVRISFGAMLLTRRPYGAAR